MALEYWRTYAVSAKDGKRKCMAVLVWDTRLKRVVERYIGEYYVAKEEYEAWRGQIRPVVEQAE